VAAGKEQRSCRQRQPEGRPARRLEICLGVHSGGHRTSGAEAPNLATCSARLKPCPDALLQHLKSTFTAGWAAGKIGCRLRFAKFGVTKILRVTYGPVNGTALPGVDDLKTSSTRDFAVPGRPLLPRIEAAVRWSLIPPTLPGVPEGSEAIFGDGWGTGGIY